MDQINQIKSINLNRETLNKTGHYFFFFEKLADLIIIIVIFNHCFLILTHRVRQILRIGNDIFQSCIDFP